MKKKKEKMNLYIQDDPIVVVQMNHESNKKIKIKISR